MRNLHTVLIVGPARQKLVINRMNYCQTPQNCLKKRKERGQTCTGAARERHEGENRKRETGEEREREEEEKDEGRGGVGGDLTCCRGEKESESNSKTAVRQTSQSTEVQPPRQG